jgi:PPOX class probable F420-dependent enzyme
VDLDYMRGLVARARVARLATIDPDGAPNLVPCVFALDGDTLHMVVDQKPKRTTALARLRNLERDPRATVLVDRYDESWQRLWWVRMRGRARVVREGPGLERALALVREKYEQYAETPIEEIAILIDVDDWRGWSAED